MSLTEWIGGLTSRFLPTRDDVAIGTGNTKLAMTLVNTPNFKIYVASNDELIGKTISETETFEPHVANLAERMLAPGDVYLDLGANIGFHTLTAAHKVGPEGRCIAIELNPENCALLRASCRANGFRHVEVIERAAAEQAGMLSFFQTPGTGNGALVSDVIRARMSDAPEFYGDRERAVQAVAVDDIVGEEDRVNLIKMDIEGAELKAIKGMRRLLSRQRPPMIFEFFPDLLRDIGQSEPVDLLDTLRGFGYAIYRIAPDSSVSTTPLNNQDAMAAATQPDGTLAWVDLLASAVPP